MPTPTILTITNAILTAYCGCGHFKQCPAGTLTAIGRPPVQGRTVAVSRQIPLESTVNVRFDRGTRFLSSRNGYKAERSSNENSFSYNLLAEDRFNKRFELIDNIKRVDIYFGTNHAAAIKFGKQRGIVTYTIHENHPHSFTKK